MTQLLKLRPVGRVACLALVACLTSCGPEGPALPPAERLTEAPPEPATDREPESPDTEKAADQPSDRPADQATVKTTVDKPLPPPPPIVYGPALDCLAGHKVLLMHYMPWYETPDIRGKWGSHWTGHEQQHKPGTLKDNGLPDIWSNYHPLMGLYDSTDPEALECQLLLMKIAGINGVIVDWYGIAKVADYPDIHKATQAMFRAAARYGMDFSVCYEDRSIELMVKWEKLSTDAVTDHLTETFKWLEEEWFSSPHYYKVNERPLLLNFGPIFLKDGAVWDSALGALDPRPQFHALHHLWKGVNADGGFTWVHWEAWDNTESPEIIHSRLQHTFAYTSADPEQIIVSAYPGFDDVYVNGHRHLPHREGRTLQETLRAGMEGKWPIIQLVTWNDYGEGTMIEPTHEFGYRFLEIIQEARKKEIGDDFPFSSEDLRLPVMLYQLRKSGQHSTETLDSIAAHLSEGDADKARQFIDSL
jgi:predicted small lipoprotein YifL